MTYKKSDWSKVQTIKSFDNFRFAPEPVIPSPEDVTSDVAPVVMERAPKARADKGMAHDAFYHKVRTLAADIQDMTAAGPGKITQTQLDKLHEAAQTVSTAKVIWGS